MEGLNRRCKVQGEGSMCKVLLTVITALWCCKSYRRIFSGYKMPETYGLAPPVNIFFYYIMPIRVYYTT